MPARNLHNTITGKDSTRLSAHLDGPSGDRGAKKVIDYSDGTEVTVERTGGATFQNGRPIMKESRTITKTKEPKATHAIDWPDGAYERIFGHS